MNGSAWVTRGLREITASAAIAPFFVPPKLTTSTPTSVVNARKGRFRLAAALEMRAPSRWTYIPRLWA